jgi:hypothetical protein
MTCLLIVLAVAFAWVCYLLRPPRKDEAYTRGFRDGVAHANACHDRGNE